MQGALGAVTGPDAGEAALYVRCARPLVPTLGFFGPIFDRAHAEALCLRLIQEIPGVAVGVTDVLGPQALVLPFSVDLLGEDIAAAFAKAVGERDKSRHRTAPVRDHVHGPADLAGEGDGVSVTASVSAMVGLATRAQAALVAGDTREAQRLLRMASAAMGDRFTSVLTAMASAAPTLPHELDSMDA